MIQILDLIAPLLTYIYTFRAYLTVFEIVW